MMRLCVEKSCENRHFEINKITVQCLTVFLDHEGDIKKVVLLSYFNIELYGVAL